MKNTATATSTAPALWIVLIVSAIGNATASVLDLNPFVGVALGVLTLICGAALVIRHRRR